MSEWDLGRVRAITFDLDYTLWDLEGVLQQAEERQYAFLAEHYPALARRYSLSDLHQLRLDLYAARPELRYHVTELRKATLRLAAQTCGYGEDLVQRAFQVFLEGRHRVVIFDDAQPLLERLRGRYVLGVITNGNARVRQLPVGRYFDFALSPMDVGAAKPERVIFHAACNRAGTPPAQVLHVGDEPEADVVGPARYGMVPVWLNRHGTPWPENLERPAHLEVRSLTELGKLLDRARYG